MDRVRFGRALGGGAREAAMALLRAADAAAAPNPSGPAAAPARTATPSRQDSAPTPVTAPFRATNRVVNLKHGGRRFGEAIWGPFAKQSGVLWLEFTGVFFGLFALSAGIGVWQHRGQLLSAGAGHHRVWLAVLMCVLFAYFTISSFVRAARRGRR